MDSIDILDFSYDASEYQKLIGKKFQVLFVDDNPEHLPFISLSEGPGIKKHAIYIRHNDGPESEEANYDEIQKIIDRRLETGYPSGKEIDLRIHLEQLKILFSQIDRTFFSGPILDSYVRSLSSAISGFTGESNPNPNYPTEDFEAFIIKVIAKKKRRIELELDTLGMQ